MNIPGYGQPDFFLGYQSGMSKDINIKSYSDLVGTLGNWFNDRLAVHHDYLSLTQSTEVALREYQLHASTDPVITEGPVCSPQTTLSGRAFTTRQPAVSRDLAQEANLDDATQLARAGGRRPSP